MTAPITSSKCKRYTTATFSPTSHPYSEVTGCDRIYQELVFFFPKEIFRHGPIGFRDATQVPEHQWSSTAYITLLQFIGEMLRYLPKNGTKPEDRKFSYTDDLGRTVPKVRVLLHLVVKNTKTPTGIGCSDELLPDDELTSMENQLGFMISLHVLDPNLDPLKLIVAMVAKNAKLMPPERQAYVAEEIFANRKNKEAAAEAAFKAAEAAAANGGRDGNSSEDRLDTPESSSGTDDEDDESGAGSGSERDARRPARRNRGPSRGIGSSGRGVSPRGGSATMIPKGRGKSNSKRRKGRSKKFKQQAGRRGEGRGPGQQKDPIEDYIVYDQVVNLHTAIALMVDTATGQPYVTNKHEYHTRHILESAIIERNDARVDLRTVLSLENTLARVREIAGPDATSEQLQVRAYLHKKAALEGLIDDDMDDPKTPPPPRARGSHQELDANLAGPGDNDMIYYKAPIPKLVWELQPEQMNAKNLMSMAFPWKAADPGMMLISIAAREMNVTVEEMLMCVRVGGGASQFAQNSQILSNAGYVASRVGLRMAAARRNSSVSLADDRSVHILDDDEMTMYQNLGHDVSTSATRTLGKQVGIIKIAIETIMQREIYKLNRTISELQSRRKQRPAKRRRTAAVAKDDDGVFIDDDEEDEPRGDASRKRPCSHTAIDDDDDDDEEVAELRKKKKIVERRRSCAIAAVSGAAHECLISLMDPSAAVPESIKSVFKWLSDHNDVTLPYGVECRNIGTFGQILASKMAMLKMRGVATNQWPITLLETCRDTGYLGPLLERVAGHLKLMGKFAGGKTDVMKAVLRGSVEGTVMFASGSSSQGLIPIYGDPSNPDGWMMVMFDELPRMFTAPTSKLRDTEEKAARICASLMTSNKVVYLTIVKNAQGELRQIIKVIYANMIFAGATNSPKARSVIEARMLTCYLTPSVKGPRNAANFMNQNTVSFGIAANNKLRAVRCTKTHHALTFMSGVSMDSGSLPLPCSARFRMYMEVVTEYLTKFYPDIAAAVRLLDVAHSIAAVWAVWNAVVLAYAPGFSDDPEAIRAECDAEERQKGYYRAENGGVFYERMGEPGDDDDDQYDAETSRWMQPELAAGNGIEFNMTQMPKRVAKFLKVTEDITFAVLAHVVHSATNPSGHMILRWLAERYGYYPYISAHKRAIRKLSLTVDEEEEEEQQDTDIEQIEKEVDEEDEDEGEEEEPKDDDAAVPPPAGDGKGAEPEIKAYEEVEAQLFKWPKARITKPRDDKLFEKRRGTRSSSSANRRRDDKRGGARGTQYLTGDNEPITDPNVIAILQHMEKVGDVTEFPLRGSAQSKRELDRDAKDVFMERQRPKYRYRQEVGRMKNGDLCLCLDPNYILVRGSLDNFASDYVTTNHTSKLGLADVRGELDNLVTKHSPAHLLNMVPIVRQESFMKHVEAHRAKLWTSRYCQRTSVPVMIACEEGWYVLVEELLEGPKHIVWKVLRHLCNESTVPRSVILPIPNKRYPETFTIFEAKPFERRLRCANPGYMGNAEISILPKTMRETEDDATQAARSPVMEWGINSDLEATEQYFKENGIDARPEEYTDQAIHARVIEARCLVKSGLKTYPKDIIRDIRNFDKRAGQMHSLSVGRSRAATVLSSQISDEPPPSVF